MTIRAIRITIHEGPRVQTILEIKMSNELAGHFHEIQNILRRTLVRAAIANAMLNDERVEIRAVNAVAQEKSRG